MWNENDLKQLEEKGISVETVEKQINTFKNGFDYMNIQKPALIGDGLIKLAGNDIKLYTRKYNYDYLFKTIIKFVPASGAASRMFKHLFEFQEAENKKELLKSSNKVGEFFNHLDKFAFYQALKNHKQLNTLDFEEGNFTIEEYLKILKVLLEQDGMNYGNLPKGLLAFHRTPGGAKTPLHEHLIEGALYASTGDEVYVHLTVSPEHIELFKASLAEILPLIEAQFEMTFNVDYSVQKTSTDTIAVDNNNQPFRNEDGTLLFRPGGHGALIENLNELDVDLIFIKNIDNVVPDRLKQETIDYKKALAGLLLEYQEIIFNYIEKLKTNTAIPGDYLNEIEDFITRKLCTVFPPSYANYSKEDKLEYLKSKLNRPIRVCGMVKNEGEPGGGPFWATNPDGSVSLQIVEASQIDMKEPNKLSIVKQSTHFNPVDLVCAVKGFKGNKFDLTKFVDPDTGFISEKSKDGKTLKALELPGLWNGAMSDWNTIFVEVPLSTFNPVKTVNDLLRPEHQPGV